MVETPQSSNIAATVFRDLRQQILRGDLPAGSRLPGERELAAKYNTNRNTLREAVRMLEQSRLVTVRHGQGVTIADFRRTGTMELLPPFVATTSDTSEVMKILQDILPARLLVLEFATRLAVRRANTSDCERLEDITELLIAAFQGGDPKVIAHGFQRWLDAVIDAGHSVAVRWIANPFLEAYRDLMDQFPMLWVVEPSFPQHLRDFISALNDGDEERAIEVTRAYYQRVDEAFMSVLEGAMASRPASSTPDASSSPSTAARPVEPPRGSEPTSGNGAPSSNSSEEGPLP